jgi:hypothetical protein
MWCEFRFIHFEKRKVEGLKELIEKGLIKWSKGGWVGSGYPFWLMHQWLPTPWVTPCVCTFLLEMYNQDLKFDVSWYPEILNYCSMQWRRGRGIMPPPYCWDQSESSWSSIYAGLPSVFNNNNHSGLHFKNRRLRSKISSESQISILS